MQDTASPQRLSRSPSGTAGTGSGADVDASSARGAFSSAIGAGIHGGVGESVAAATSGGGRQLDTATRGAMEKSFGTDLGGVRIHDGAAAASSASQLGAAAYAVGNDVVFGAGQYQPHTPQGQHLIAHELAHTVQQQGSASSVQMKSLELGAANDAFEHDADRAADRVAAGETNVANAIVRGAPAVRRFITALPFTNHDFLTTPRTRHNVNTIAHAKVFPGGQPVREQPFNSHELAMDVPAGTNGSVQIYGWGHYEANTGGVLEPQPDIGEFTWRTDWSYECADDRALNIREPRHVPSVNPTLAPVLRNPLAVSITATTAANQVATPISISQSAGGGPSVSVGPVGTSTGALRSETGGLQLPMSLRLNPTGGHAPAPAGGAEATAHARGEASADASASVTVPMPEPAPTVPMQTVYFEREGQVVGDEGALVRSLHALPRAAQTAIRAGRLHVVATGYASTTGDEGRNRNHYGLRRAQWAQGVIARTFGIEVRAVSAPSLGADTAPEAERETRGGVANPHERRVEIEFEEANPMTAVTTTATGSGSARATGRAHAGPPTP